MIKRDLSLVHKADSTCRNQCNHHINRLKKRKIILSYQYKYKIQNLFMIKKKTKKTSQNNKNRAKLPQLDKEHLQETNS